MYRNLFLNKNAGPKPATLLENSLRHKRFSVDFVKFLTAASFIEHLRWLLLTLSWFFMSTSPWSKNLQTPMIKSYYKQIWCNII